MDYVLQACVAIAEAHAVGIVHRDLKPANLFLTRRIDGSPLIKVLDFGIAKAPAAGESRITRTSMVMSSPGCMSPEQLRSTHDADARSDIWALGVILYELVSGRLPFRGDSITELAMKVTVDPPEPQANAAAGNAAAGNAAAGNAAAGNAAAGNAAAGNAAATPAALRDKLQALAAAHDWSAVLEFADLGRGDPDLAAIIGDARKQYLAQQARAIDAQAKQGQCARARELAAAAKKRVPDDTILEPRARACKPRTTSPEPPATLAAATAALDRREFPRALELAEKLVAADPGDAAAARVAALAACSVKDVDKATRYAGKLRGGDRSAVHAQCEANHIDLDGTPPGGSSGPRPGGASGSAPSGPASDGSMPSGPAPGHGGPTSGPGAADEPDGPGAATPGREMLEAQDAAKAGDWSRALSAAESVLQRTPRNPAALRIGVLAACHLRHLRKEKTAQTLLRRVAPLRQRALRQQCAEQGVLL